MPNQLAQSKRRQSLAEHAAVLAALSTIARWEHTTVMALLREAARDAVRKRVALPAHAAELRAMIAPMAPRMPPRFWHDSNAPSGNLTGWCSTSNSPLHKRCRPAIQSYLCISGSD